MPCEQEWVWADVSWAEVQHEVEDQAKASGVWIAFVNVDVLSGEG